MWCFQRDELLSDENRQADIADGMDIPWPYDCNKGVLPYLNGNAMYDATQTDAMLSWWQIIVKLLAVMGIVPWWETLG